MVHADRVAPFELHGLGDQDRRALDELIATYRRLHCRVAEILRDNREELGEKRGRFGAKDALEAMIYSTDDTTPRYPDIEANFPHLPAHLRRQITISLCKIYQAELKDPQLPFELPTEGDEIWPQLIFDRMVKFDPNKPGEVRLKFPPHCIPRNKPTWGWKAFSGKTNLPEYITPGGNKLLKPAKLVKVDDRYVVEFTCRFRNKRAAHDGNCVSVYLNSSGDLVLATAERETGAFRIKRIPLRERLIDDGGDGLSMCAVVYAVAKVVATHAVSVNKPVVIVEALSCATERFGDNATNLFPKGEGRWIYEDFLFSLCKQMEETGGCVVDVAPHIDFNAVESWEINNDEVSSIDANAALNLAARYYDIIDRKKPRELRPHESLEYGIWPSSDEDGVSLRMANLILFKDLCAQDDLPF